MLYKCILTASRNDKQLLVVDIMVCYGRSNVIVGYKYFIDYIILIILLSWSSRILEQCPVQTISIALAFTTLPDNTIK
jgi:hypothetical protein